MSEAYLVLLRILLPRLLRKIRPARLLETFAVGCEISSCVERAAFRDNRPHGIHRIVVYVALDNPRGVIQYGGTVAAPIAVKKTMVFAKDDIRIELKEGFDKEFLRKSYNL